MEEQVKDSVKQWYHLHPVDDKQAVVDLAKELIEHEDGAEVKQTHRHMFLYTAIGWDELIDEFDEVAHVGVDHTEGGSKQI